MKRLLFAILAAAVLTPMANADETAPQILSRVAKAYASMQSYTDRGVVLLYFPENEPPNETMFETVFARPALFRFAWISHHPYPPLRHITWPAVIWSDGSNSFTRHEYEQGRPETRKEASLAMAIAGATGVSGGAAHTVPRLLMPEIGGFSIEELTSTAVLDLETFEGARCFHIVGQTSRTGPVQIWIGADDGLIRKLKLQLLGIAREEIRRDIHVNEYVSTERFSP